MRNETHQQTLEKIVHNNQALDIAGVKQVLILHEEELTNIGDWVLRFDMLKYLKGYLQYADITINFTAEGTNTIYEPLLKNNPHLHAITAMKWPEIDFEQYDLVISVSYNEPAILAYMHERYSVSVLSDQFRLCVFTMSHYMIKQKPDVKPLFPIHKELGLYAEKHKTPVELFVTKEEQEWADNWLREKGLKENEQLFIILDTTTRREKLLSMPVYFGLISDLLKRENVKVLNFDEANIGKEKFYSELLGAKLTGKFIFSKGLSIREAMCLLASSYTKLVFGPCTGMMHCASGIYNNYVSNGLNKAQAPVLITYTGKYLPDEGHVYLWWNNAPLMNVLVLRNRNNNKTILLLDDLNDVEKVTNDGFPCADYTARMLTEFVNQKLPYRIEQLV